MKKITHTEKTAATRLQAPLSWNEFSQFRPERDYENLPQLEWVKAADYVHLVFYVIRVWAFESRFGSKIGIELMNAETEEKVLTSLPYNQEREELCQAFKQFKQANPNAMLGPVTFEAIDVGQSMPYLKLVPVFQYSRPSTSPAKIGEDKPKRGRKPRATLTGSPVPSDDQKPKRGRKPRATQTVSPVKSKTRKKRSTDDVPF